MTTSALPLSGSTAALRAWLYEVGQDGTSLPMRTSAGLPLATVLEPGGTLYVSVQGGQNTPDKKYLRVPQAEGMSLDPVTVTMDKGTGYWMIKNSGHTNTLRIQQYGLAAVPLRPQTSMPMAGSDVAVWIPVVPRLASGKSESFRLLMLSGPEKSTEALGPTVMITAPRHYLSPAKQEALIAYFGDHLSWPPLPAPHVRQQAEVERIAVQFRLSKAPSPERWARNRFDVLAGRDGLFRDADWFPRLGGPERSLANHLAAFHRLVELRTITLRRVCQWAVTYEVVPYAIIDRQLIPGSTASGTSRGQQG